MSSSIPSLHFNDTALKYLTSQFQRFVLASSPFDHALDEQMLINFRMYSPYKNNELCLISV